MNAKKITLFAVLMLVIGLLAGCASDAPAEQETESVADPAGSAGEARAAEASTEAAGLPPAGADLNQAQIADRLRQEGQLLIYYPAGSNFKKWLNDTLVPAFEAHIKETYEVDLQIALLSTGGGDAAFWQKLQAFKEAGGQPGQFDIDVTRVSPNFQTLEAIDNGWFLPILPDYAALTPNLTAVNEAGLNTFTVEGSSYAIPFYQPTVSIFYNSDTVETPPRTLEELRAWIKENPQRFTYEDPRSSSGVGSGTMFLLAVMHHFGDESDPATWDEAWSYLQDIQPDVYPQPSSGEQALELMRRGEIDMMAFWNDWGIFAKETLEMPFMENYLLESGMPIRNTPFAIPADAQHPVGALLFIDFALSPEMQASLGQVMHQIPGTTAADAWEQIPADAFGFEYRYIIDNTFPAFNSRQNVEAIKVMAEGWSENVLDR